ncbi:hypothetical protein GLAREA_03812 [Glarea lozoyensis ATCC 20868]|uniref:Uncharacterized protein n=1 Tax=Glarea lozoyensis (strain ATCC 20868 / MF5171) TaxID=1116229 RepID=S3CZ43_GLAL2|nr:uncharacterized protein GLAREA_03812 [Glarea lozoyensis ATCC 20868]EPE30845.1 hypothetical protein GLAREA_03812 [Glarea lozoyensis ATCC 20868]
MVRPVKDPAAIKLKQPDRSGPSDETLLGFAEKAGILDVPQQKGKTEDEEPLIGRLGESLLWSVSLTMLHFTLDVLVMNQYAVQLDWNELFQKTIQALPGSQALHPSQDTNADVYLCSVPLVFLHFPSSSVSVSHPPKSHSSNSAPVPPTFLLSHECRGRLLSHPYNQQLQLLRDHEAISPLGLYMDMVCD